jgi:DNA-directed RNA polymerase subunit RPC12/RpoP
METTVIRYRCWNCGRVFSKEDIEAFEYFGREGIEGFGYIRCPYCASKIITKIRKEIPKMVKAI